MDRATRRLELLRCSGEISQQGNLSVPNIKRTLLLKRVVQRPSDRFPAIPNLVLHDSMNAVFAAATTVWDRHYPSRDKVAPGKRCVFFERVNRVGATVVFHAYSYIAGHTPDQVVLDDLAATISAEPIVDEDGEHKEIVERFCILVYGEALVLESARVAGSSMLAIRAIRDLIKRHSIARCPALELEDAPSVGFQNLVAMKGGIDSVTARLHQGFNANPNTFGSALENLITRSGFPQAGISTTIQAPNGVELDATQVEEILDESETGIGLSGITVKFKDGTFLNEIASYREKTVIEVQQIRAGVPAIPEIETALVDYIRELVQPAPNGFRLLDGNGRFT